jgi:primosomal protein N' (replication factor Y)
LDPLPRLTEDQFRLAQWISEYYVSSLGETLFSIVPSCTPPRKKEKVPPDSSLNIPLHSLTPLQQETIRQIRRHWSLNPSKPVLLYGVTGSGKTEIYLSLIKETLAACQSVLLLVPEIGLSHQTVQQVKRHFSSVAVLHSQMTQIRKLRIFREIQSGRKNIVIGPRSAIFAPVVNLGLIILDEEHSSFYKEHSSPRYHARQVAFMRSRISHAKILLGSATPSAESYHLAQKGQYGLVALTERFNSTPLPQIDILKHNPRIEILHPVMRTRIEEKLGKNEQVILFFNKRGFANLLYCQDCGHVLTCEACEIPYTYHKSPEERLQCHFCGVIRTKPQTCPQCGSVKLSPRGMGTQKIEMAIKKIFPDAKVARFDFDTTRKKDETSSLYQDFRDHKIDILVGTQMLGHGFHFPHVTFVGIIGFEMMLNWPDFRSVEHTLSLLFQISGRAGRGEIPGEVVVQTSDETIPFLKHLKTQDYLAFLKEELEARKKYGYPPFQRLVRFLFKSKKAENALKMSGLLASEIQRLGIKASMLGPAPAPLAKLGSQFRVHLLLKFQARNEKVTLQLSSLKSFILSNNIACEMDVDPIDLI